MNAKRLHLHVVPVIITATGFAYVSMYVLIHLMVMSTSQNSLTALIGAHLYSIRPASNGFFHISRAVTTAQTETGQPVQNSVVGQAFMTGQDTELQASLKQ